MKIPPRIAIVGAGPGGLVLARILQRRGISATVFEGEAFSSARPQGWSLDMHAESGQFAIQCAELGSEFKRIARYDDQEGRVYDKHGTLRFADTNTSEGNRPEVDRAQLRQMLLDSLPADVIRWDHKLSTAHRQDDGTVALEFRNGVRQTFDLVVGADGAWSRVRPMVSDARPEYSGVLFLELGIDDVDARHPDLARLVGRGLMFALGDGKGLIAHRDANAHIGIYAGLRVPADWSLTGDGTTSGDALKTCLAGHFSDWADDLRQLIYRSSGSLVPRPIYALPVGHRWEHQPGITLLGDAAHLMSPFTGEGANLAMRDAADLALTLASDGIAAVQGYETVMFARAEEAAAGARDGIDGAFSTDGLSYLLRQMEGHRA